MNNLPWFSKDRDIYLSILEIINNEPSIGYLEILKRIKQNHINNAKYRRDRKRGIVYNQWDEVIMLHLMRKLQKLRFVADDTNSLKFKITDLGQSYISLHNLDFTLNEYCHLQKYLKN